MMKIPKHKFTSVILVGLLVGVITFLNLTPVLTSYSAVNVGNGVGRTLNDMMIASSSLYSVATGITSGYVVQKFLK